MSQRKFASIHQRHRWGVLDGVEVCEVSTCGKTRDHEAAKRSRSSVRMGKDNERRLAKRYGWLKVGQLGDAVDLLGDHVKVQSKATRAAVPDFLASSHGIAHVDVLPGYVMGPLQAMDGLYPDRIGIVVRSFVHAGRSTTDYIYIRANDWLALHGGEPRIGFYVMGGGYWLDVHGRESGV